MNNFKNKIIEYISNNKLFLLFFIFCLVMDFLLRCFTIGGRVYFLAFLADMLILLFISLFAYLIKKRYHFVYYFIWLIFFTILVIANTVYYEFYESFISVNLLETASMIGEVNDSLFAKLHFHQFLYLLFPVIYIILYKKFFKFTESVIIENNKISFKFNLIFMLIIFGIFLFSFNYKDISKFSNLRNREYIVKKYGLYLYTGVDLISIAESPDNIAGYEKALYNYKDYYSCKWEKNKEVNAYTNIFKGKNVIFIHAESIQNFLVNLKINGEEVTPNINKLASEGIYFNNFYPQISVGTSSDTEFTLLTGLMPSSSGTVFVNYYDRLYYGMPSYFSDLGYYTFSMHGNDREYWNRATMHEILGYDDFYGDESYIIPDKSDSEFIGLGLSDKSFFEQSIPKLKEISNNKSPYFGTIITLSNHSPFNDLEKYGEFDVTIDYKYTDKNGKTINDTASYLEDSTMGNYIKSSHYADEALGVLFDELKSEGLLENTVIVFYGDHEARLSKKEFNLLYNYDPVNDDILDEDDENYISMDNYYYDLLKSTPFIIWTNDMEKNLVVEDVMGMYDVLPTIANMFGFEEKYSLGNDIFSNNEKIVVFPNGNVLTNKIYYSDSNDEYITLTNEPIDGDYIENIKEYANNILNVSNGIIYHDLIANEGKNVGECSNE